VSRQLKLNLFIYPGGHHEAAWRYRESEPDRVLDLDYYIGLARRAEEATFDAIFLADGPALADNIRYASRFRIEPFTWLSGIAAATSKIGLIATASTTYSEPYNLARLFAGLDHLSKGRAGWNIVTTGAPNAAQNFGLAEHPVHAERYDRAQEFVEVVTKLWDSWEDGALIADPSSGIYADGERIHSIDHIGRRLRVRGPLNTPRTPQGRPVYVQAGSSEDGRSFAARYAEAIFTAHQTLQNAQAFYTDVTARALALGRRQPLILPGISPFIGSTEAEALALQAEFDELTQPEYSLQQLHRLAGARGHWVVAGTPEQIADQIEEWFTNGAADGFNVMPPWLTGGFDLFADHVVPILRSRGLFRRSYTGSTLREHYGLSRPDSQYDTLPTAEVASA